MAAEIGSLEWVRETTGVTDLAAVTQLLLNNKGIDDKGAQHLSEVLRKCPNLTKLRLSKNNIGDQGTEHLSEALPHCPNLTALILYHNAIRVEGAKHLSKVLHKLCNLTTLSLYPVTPEGAAHIALAWAQHPRLTNVHLNFALNKCLAQLNLPPELADADNAKILALLRERAAQGAVSLSIAKVLVTGPGSAGKTCFVRTLAEGSFPPQNPGMTDGMEVQPMPADDGVTLLFYDFGGQPVYATTNQFFLNCCAVYVVAWDPRVGEGEPPHGFVQDMLDANKNARILFVMTKADEGHVARPDIEQHLQRAYAGNFAGFLHVSAKRGDNLAELKAALVREAKALPFMGQELPASYGRLRRRVEELAADKARFHLTGEEWHHFATEAGVPEEGHNTALDLFHSWGLVLRLPSRGTETPPVVLRPADLAAVLSDVISVHTDKANDCRNGLLRHSTIDTVWHAYPPELRPYFLELLHSYDLGVPLVIDGPEGNLQATLVPAMLSPDSRVAYGVLRELLASNASRQRQADAVIKLSSVPTRFLPHLLVQLRLLLVFGGWWKQGAVVAARGHGGKIEALGTVAVDEANKTLRVASYGSLVLRKRVLGALQQLRKERFPGVKVYGASAECLGLDGMPEHTFHFRISRLEPREFEHHTFSDLIDFIASNEWAASAAVAAEVPAAGMDGDPAVPALMCGESYQEAGEGPGEREALLVDIDKHFQQLRGAATDGPHAKLLQALRCVVALSKAQIGLLQGSMAKVLWLTYQHKSPSAAADATVSYFLCPLRPRWEGVWVVDPDLMVTLPGPCATEHDLTPRVHELLTVLSVQPPKHGLVFHSLAADCRDHEELVFDVRHRTELRFRALHHPELGELWVHEEDKNEFSLKSLVATSKDIARGQEALALRQQENDENNERRYKDLARRIKTLHAVTRELSLRVTDGFESSVAQAAAGNQALLGALQELEGRMLTALRHLEDSTNSAIVAQDADLQAALGQIQESAANAAKEARGAAQDSLDEAVHCLESLQAGLTVPKDRPEAAGDGTDQAIFREQVLEALASLKEQVGEVDTKVDAARSAIAAAVDASRANTKLLRTLLSMKFSSGKPCYPPRIVWVRPMPEEQPKHIFHQLGKAVMSKLNPKQWLTETVLVTFVCPVTLRVAECGPGGKGFEIKMAKEQVLKMLPYLKTGLLVLQVAVAAGRALGLPVPNMADVGEKLSAAEREARAMGELLTACGQMAVEYAPGAAEGPIPDVESLERATEPGRIQATRELLDASARHTCELLEKAAGSNWGRECGLVLVKAKDGTVEWVHPSVAEEFKRQGEALLGGRVEPSPPSPPPPPRPQSELGAL